MLKKVFLLLFFSVFLAGCGYKNNENELTFSSWGSITEVKVLKQLISDFEQQNPDIKINFIHIPQNYFQKIHLLFASNTEPDVIFINNMYLPLYETKLEDLSIAINKDEFYPQVIESLSYNNKILAIPRDVSNLVFYVNLDLLKENGLKMPSKNWTIEDLLKYAQILSGKNQWGISYEEDIYWVTPYLAYFGGGILSENNELIIDKNESKNAIKFYKDLVNKYQVAPSKIQVGSSTLAQMFLDKKIALYLSGKWMYPKIKEKADFDWTVINFPYGKNLQLLDSSGWAISKNSKNKENAYRFINYLASKNSIKYFSETGLIIPARKDFANDTEKVFLDVIEHSKKTPVTKNYKNIIDDINLNLF